MRVAVVDIGTNSTRLLIADVDASTGRVSEVVRRSTVTRLGAGVDGSGRLSDEGMERVFDVLADYRAQIDAAGGVDACPAVLTSAARDAANGEQFTRRVREDFLLDARVIAGEEEARLSYLGATSGRAAGGGPIVVLDIGGGSTEMIVGEGSELRFHVSTQAGVVRQSERHIRHDPPLPREVDAIALEAGEIFRAAVPVDLREEVSALVAVAGTATSVAAIDQALEPYDSARVHGYVASRETCEAILGRLAAMTEAERRAVPGLHPDRAATIVAGCVFLVAALEVFGMERFEVSEHDILYGVALTSAE